MLKLPAQAIESLDDAQLNFIELEGDQQWQAPVFVNSWANANAAAPVGFVKSGVAVVYLRGRIATGTSGTVAFTLPVGYRPGILDYYPMFAAGATFGGCTVDVTGDVKVFTASGGSPTDLSFGGVRFIAEN